MPSAFDTGHQDALKRLGLEKIAVMVPGKAPLLRRMGQWLRQKAPTRSGVQRFLVGDPRQFGREIMQGKALGKGSLLRKSFHAPDAFSKVMFYGLPAVDVASTALDDKGDKGRRIGETLGGAALGLAAWRPFGMLGSMAADTLGRRLGGAMGQTSEYLATGKRTSPQGTTAPYEQAMDAVSQAGRAAGMARRVPQIQPPKSY